MQASMPTAIPACDEARAFMRQLASGEARGGLGYVVPLVNPEVAEPTYSRGELAESPEKLLHLRLAGLARRQWGHDFGVPMLNPRAQGGDLIAYPFGSRYYTNPTGTIPGLKSAEELESLRLDVSLADGLFPQALQTIEYFARATAGQVTIERYQVAGPLDAAALILKNEELLAALYTHPRAVHRLLDKCAELYIAFQAAQRKIDPNVVLVTMHDTYWPPGLGVLCNENFLSVISPRMALEFSVPRLNLISDAFGGVVVHACGNMAHQFETLKRHVRNLRGIFFNAGECSFKAAVEAFRGTDVVLVPRWVLNSQYRFESRVDFVKQVLAAKAPDVSVFLLAHRFADQSLSDPSVPAEADPNSVSREILRVIETYVSRGVIE